MNRLLRRRASELLVLLVLLHGNYAIAAKRANAVNFRHPLTTSARRCLHDILITGNWRYSPRFHEEMMTVAAFAQATLDGPARKQYIYIMDEFSFCGTAGCSMLIGEVGKDGACFELYDGDGLTYATDVLRRRDHGYRRLYTPCELRFDGHEYRQIHDECPTVDVPR